MKPAILPFAGKKKIRIAQELESIKALRPLELAK
jgi:hypothetical protein